MKKFTMADETTSLNKFISSTGICSRREADKWIEAGRVKINGEIARKGNRVSQRDQVTIDDQPLTIKPAPIYIAFHKPAGVTCTTDRRDKDNIVDFIGHPQRIFPIGRLDKASTGLLLLTNDGDIVNEILRAEKNNEKEYIVSVNQPVNERFIKRMSNGIPILGTITQKCSVEQINQKLFRIILTQGLNRQIRRMCEYLGYKVVTLKRIRIMHIQLGDLKVGRWRNLTKQELKLLKATLRSKA